VVTIDKVCVSDYCATGVVTFVYFVLRGTTRGCLLEDRQQLLLLRDEFI
jgi:hypothetical protein